MPVGGTTPTDETVPGDPNFGVDSDSDSLLQSPSGSSPPPVITDQASVQSIPTSDVNVEGGTPFEVWHNSDGETFLVWMTPALEDGDADLPVAYRIPDAESFKDLFGAGATLQSIASTTTVRPFDLNSGVVVLGTTDLIPDPRATDMDGLDMFMELYEKRAGVEPWLRDPEVMALIIGAELVEGRAVTDAEWQQTEWWQTHSAAERSWLELVNGDPAQAQQALEDQRTNAEQLLRNAGVNNPDSALVNFIADKVTMGSWSATYANQQVTKLSDPFAPGDLDGELRAFGQVDRTQAEEDTVRNLITEWLGPRLSNGWSQEWVEQQAGLIRNDPDHIQVLTDRLQRQRLAMFPEYTDPTLSYEDIAGPWRQVVSQEWGEIPDEVNDWVFSRVLQLNDLGEAQKLLRTEGLSRNNFQVTQNALEGLAATMGGPVRRADRALL